MRIAEGREYITSPGIKLRDSAAETGHCLSRTVAGNDAVFYQQPAVLNYRQYRHLLSGREERTIIPGLHQHSRVVNYQAHGTGFKVH